MHWAIPFTALKEKKSGETRGGGRPPASGMTPGKEQISRVAKSEGPHCPGRDAARGKKGGRDVGRAKGL